MLPTEFAAGCLAQDSLELDLSGGLGEVEKVTDVGAAGELLGELAADGEVQGRLDGAAPFV